jgi:hypothetical protein
MARKSFFLFLFLGGQFELSFFGILGVALFFSLGGGLVVFLLGVFLELIN